MTDLSGEYAEQNADVMKLGADHCLAMLDGAKELVAFQEEGRRVLYFASVMRVITSCMVASIGNAATLAVLDSATDFATTHEPRRGTPQ